MADLIILADGGGSIGFGHLMRCLAIKSAWSNGTARLLVAMEGGEYAPDGTEAFDWLNGVHKLKQFVTINTVLLVDSYRPTADYFRLLKSMFPFVVVLDDYNRITYPVDLIICPSVYGKDIDYSNQLSVAVGGPEYVILRPEILATRQQKLKEAIETVLVTFGGSQQDESLYQNILNILEDDGYRVVVVTGNDSLARKLIAKTSKVYGRLSPVAMAELMASVDVAVSSAGQTLNEFAWLGIPTFSIKTGEDQHRNWDYYKHHDLSLGAVMPDVQNLALTLIETLKKETVFSRLNISQKLRGLLTATGANKISALIEDMGSIGNE